MIITGKNNHGRTQLIIFSDYSDMRLEFTGVEDQNAFNVKVVDMFGEMSDFRVIGDYLSITDSDLDILFNKHLGLTEIHSEFLDTFRVDITYVYSERGEEFEDSWIVNPKDTEPFTIIAGETVIIKNDKIRFKEILNA